MKQASQMQDSKSISAFQLKLPLPPPFKTSRRERKEDKQVISNRNNLADYIKRQKLETALSRVATPIAWPRERTRARWRRTIRLEAEAPLIGLTAVVSRWRLEEEEEEAAPVPRASAPSQTVACVRCRLALLMPLLPLLILLLLLRLQHQFKELLKRSCQHLQVPANNRPIIR